MSVLNKAEIKALMGHTDYTKKLLVTPLLTEDQIGPASVDVRLGSSIIVPRRTFVGSHDVTDVKMVRQVERRLYDRIRLKYHSEFILHPNQLVLAVTLEYISLPFNVFCQVASRSSWGRLGLVVATASIVQPGFKGCLTLELANLSDSPITLYPGLLVGQLVFMRVEASGEQALYHGRYDCPTEAGLPGFFARNMDEEMNFWGHQGN
ncbi:MAG TPA: dCTP deaminase [Clostridia bacterium]|nr:dCTP deaminase [Clostridia bacterium]